MSVYRHKSGAEKRKLRLEREKKSAIGAQKITNFFEKGDVTKTETRTVATTSGAGSSASRTPTNILLETESKEKHREIISSVKLKPESSSEVGIVRDNETLDLKDPANWPDIITETVRQHIVSVFPKFDELQSHLQKAPTDVINKKFSKFLLYTKSSNNREKYPRDWLIWSPKNKSLHCFPCLLFGSNLTEFSASHSILAKRQGFTPQTRPWKQLYAKFPLHENKMHHKSCYLKWKDFEQSLLGHGVDSNLQKQIICEAETWKSILRRLLDVTLFLGSRGLAFQGDTTKIGDVHNGNFLGTLELLGRYDEVTHQHLAMIQRNQLEGKTMRGKAHYLSWQSQNEFISLCGGKVLSKILEEVRNSIFYSIISDATPDNSHIEQNVLLLRYVNVTRKEDKEYFEIMERFIEFIDYEQKSGEDIADMITSRLEYHAIPLNDCRGQGYDNGANMSGKVKGVQARIREKNPLALFSPCAAHSLNLTGVHAASLCVQSKTFFGCVQRLYTFFSGSPARWSILKENVNISLKPQSDTRWSSRVEAVRPVALNLPGIKNALDRVISEKSLNSEAHSDAMSLKKYFWSFESIVLSSFWFKILSSINERNVIIQARGISLQDEICLIENLKKEILHLRNQWSQILSEASSVATGLNITPKFTVKRKRQRKAFSDEIVTEGNDEYFELEDPNERTFRIDVVYATIDYIINDLDNRFVATKEIEKLFSSILYFSSLEENDLEQKSKVLIDHFSADLSHHFTAEILHLKKIYKSIFKEDKLSPLSLLNKIYEKNLQPIFPNICISLRLFCTIPVTVAEAERSFSKLSLIKNWKRATTGQERLNNLALLSIENEIAMDVDFSDIIQEFAMKKARKVTL